MIVTPQLLAALATLGVDRAHSGRGQTAARACGARRAARLSIRKGV